MLLKEKWNVIFGFCLFSVIVYFVHYNFYFWHSADTNVLPFNFVQGDLGLEKHIDHLFDVSK